MSSGKSYFQSPYSYYIHSGNRFFGWDFYTTEYMIYQIDQSGKVEDTNKLTVVAFANGKIKSLKISAGEKRKLIQVMRTLDYPRRTFIYKIFAGLIFLLIKNEKAEKIIIDREYPGHEGIIKDVLTNLFKKADKKIPDISFFEIGKKEVAHNVAIDIFRGKRRADIIVNADNVLKILYK